MNLSCCLCGVGVQEATLLEVDGSGRVACCKEHKDCLLGKSPYEQRGWFCIAHQAEKQDWKRYLKPPTKEKK